MGTLAAWFDIPVIDIERAIRFYQQVTEQTLTRLPVAPDRETALFEADGCLFRSPEDQPSHFGTRVYFDATPDISAWLDRVQRAGGRTLLPETEIGGGMGTFAYFEDSEGNRVGLHCAPSPA